MRTSPHFLATAIYGPSHCNAAAYFERHLDRLGDNDHLINDRLTGDDLVLSLHRFKDVNSAYEEIYHSDMQLRFPGLQITDVPCIWVEDDRGRGFSVKLHDGAGMEITGGEIEHRIQMLSSAAKERDSIGKLKYSMGALGQVERPKKKYVIIMHGIRDEGNWMAELRQLIDKKTKATAIPINIDRIALGRFLLARKYSKYILDYRNAIHTVIRNLPEDDADLVFIAHSYGTWCLADILSNWSDARKTPTQIVLCGSILPTDYKWSDVWIRIFKKPFDAGVPWVWNDIGGSDPFPLLARLVSKDYGDGGSSRFHDPTVGLIVNRVHAELGHSGCFIIKDEHNISRLNVNFVNKYWLPIIRDAPSPRQGNNERQSLFVQRLCYWTKAATEMNYVLLVGGVATLFGVMKGSPCLTWTSVLTTAVVWLSWFVYGWCRAERPVPEKAENPKSR